MSTTAERPSSVRFLVIAAATLMAFLLYLDRFCISFAVDYIRQDLGLMQRQISWFISAFFWSYALAQVPSGWLSDRYGARIMLVIYILTWSVFTALIGASASFAMLMLTRLGCGLGQAGAYPTAASVVARWVPMTSRGIASGVVANGGRIGGAVAPLLTAYLIVLCLPADTPIEIQAQDLLQPKSIVTALSTDGEAAYLRTQLDGSSLNRIDTLAVELGQDEVETDVASGGQARRATASEDSAQSASDAEQLRTELLPVLNGLIDIPDLYDAKHMLSLNLPRQATQLLKRQRAGETLSHTDQRLLNRFVLEGVFGREIAKLYRHGWRPILYIYGAAGIIVAIFFWYVFRERPDLHPWSNPAEFHLIMRGRESAVKHHGRKLGPAPVRELMLSGNMWFCCVMQWGTNIGWLFIMTWFPRYLMDVHQVPILERGYMTMTPPLIGIAGMALGGKMTDVIAARYGVKWGRRLPIVSSRVTASLAYVGCICLGVFGSTTTFYAPWVFTGLLSIVAFSTDFGAAPTWAFNQDIAGRHVGSVLGWGNMWGNLGAACAPPIYNYFLGEEPTLHDWNLMFGVCAASFLLSSVCALLIDSSRPILKDDEPVEINP